jgi:pilus assembly protein CpaB
VGSKRTIILVVALVVGALAGYLLYNYVNGVEDRAYQNADRVGVFVVKQPIPANMTGQEALNKRLIVQAQIPREFRPATALVDSSTINAKLAKTDLAVGQVVVDNMFVDKVDATSTWRDRLGTNVAITVQLDQVKGMAGILQAGDEVTLLVELDGAENPANPAPARSVRFLYSNVQVMAINGQGASVAGAPGGDPVAVGGPITFRVPLKAAEKIALAGTKMYIALEPVDFVPTDADLVAVDWTNLFQGEKSPYGADATKKADPAAPAAAPAAAG